MPNTKTSPSVMVREATRVFRRRGYHRTSMADLAAAAGVTKGAFYHHFADKAAVMEAALTGLCDYASREVFSAARDVGRPLAERVTLLEDGARRLFAEGEAGCFVANTALETAGVEERFRPQLRRFVDEWRACLAALGAEAGADDPAGFAVRAVADVEGSIVLMQVYDDIGYLEAALGRLRENLLPS